MPAVSRAQFRKMKAMEGRGEVSHKAAAEFTPRGLYGRLPERKGRKARRSVRR